MLLFYKHTSSVKRTLLYWLPGVFLRCQLISELHPFVIEHIHCVSMAELMQQMLDSALSYGAKFLRRTISVYIADDCITSKLHPTNI